jgi:hypothetical protein
MRRRDYLALAPSGLVPPTGLEDARLYHQDRELGLRCLDAGLRGTFDRRLHAVHEHRRDPAGFLRDAFGRGVCDVALHHLHPAHVAAPSPRPPVPAPLARSLLHPEPRSRTLGGLRAGLDAAVATGSWRLTATTARGARKAAYRLGAAAALAAGTVGAPVPAGGAP